MVSSSIHPYQPIEHQLDIHLMWQHEVNPQHSKSQRIVSPQDETIQGYREAIPIQHVHPVTTAVHTNEQP